MTGAPPKFVAFFDVDNTLLDNDALKLQLRNGLDVILGDLIAGRYWEIYEIVRRDIGHVDIPQTLDRLHVEFPDAPIDIARAWILEFPFAQTLFPGAIEAIQAVEAFGGAPAILSDGDAVFQTKKIESAGLSERVGGRVLVYEHKEDHIQEVLDKYPARGYLMIDDKARLLGKFKTALGDRITTVHVLRGLYATDQVDPGDPIPDFAIERISDLPDLLPKLELVAR